MGFSTPTSSKKTRYTESAKKPHTNIHNSVLHTIATTVLHIPNTFNIMPTAIGKRLVPY